MMETSRNDTLSGAAQCPQMLGDPNGASLRISPEAAVKWEASLGKTQQIRTQDPTASWLPELLDTLSPPTLQASHHHLSGRSRGQSDNVSTGTGKTPEALERAVRRGSRRL